ncbi:hypothetical protein NDU88_002031 [Pleurodeles waltl]|uniref:Uncharacterized protein n=1 Tax=Pleurodeles waltl TaxID=8319 RepID=A0AAV7VY84_PLEWA|nr:hypothetical protein NDU88_002031 [Pleurodeles waltl]
MLLFSPGGPRKDPQLRPTSQPALLSLSNGARGRPSSQGPSRDTAHLVSTHRRGRGLPPVLSNAPPALLGSLLLAALFRRGPPTAAISPGLRPVRHKNSSTQLVLRAPGRDGATPPRQTRSRRSRSTHQRTPPRPLRSVAQVCCAGGSGAGFRLNGEVKGPTGAHGLRARHLGSRSHAPVTGCFEPSCSEAKT